jgi:hypothetical protein
VTLYQDKVVPARGANGSDCGSSGGGASRHGFPLPCRRRRLYWNLPSLLWRFDRQVRRRRSARPHTHRHRTGVPRRSHHSHCTLDPMSAPVGSFPLPATGANTGFSCLRLGSPGPSASAEEEATYSLPTHPELAQCSPHAPALDW